MKLPLIYNRTSGSGFIFPKPISQSPGDDRIVRPSFPGRGDGAPMRRVKNVIDAKRPYQRIERSMWGNSLAL